MKKALIKSRSFPNKNKFKNKPELNNTKSTLPQSLRPFKIITNEIY